jgi:hypothetical protein
VWPSTSAIDHPSGRDPFLAAFESSKAPSSPIIPVGRVMGSSFIGLLQLIFSVDVRAQSGKEVPKVNCGLAIEDWMYGGVHQKLLLARFDKYECYDRVSGGISWNGAYR